jgi:hypothetical protein
MKPTAATPKPQPHWMTWRAAVTCRERERERERDEIILNITLLAVSMWGEQYREELILNVTVFVVRVYGRAI